MESTAYTRVQMEARVMLKGGRLMDLMLSYLPANQEIPGTVENGILTVPVEDIELFINKQRAAAAQAMIRAFLETAFEE